MQTQSSVVLLLPVATERVSELELVLQNAAFARGFQSALDAVSEAHFARLLILPATSDTQEQTIAPWLVYSACVDGSEVDHLRALADSSVLDPALAICEGYPGSEAPAPAGRLAYLLAHRVSAQAFYANTVGRTRRQIHRDDRLFRSLQTALDQAWSEGEGKAPTRNQLRARLRPVVRPYRLRSEEPGLRRLRFFRTLRTVGLVVFGLLLLPVLVVLAGVGLVAVRLQERKEEGALHRLSVQDATRAAVFEDRVVQNPFAGVGLVKPGWFRAMVLRVALYVANLGIELLFYRGNLAGFSRLGLDGVNTIHFARWIVIDGGRRVLFMSDYDGSLESYMDDFVNKVAWGLNAVFSNGLEYPSTRWLVLDGANDEQQFKAFLRKRQLPTPVWFSAYPHLTAVNLLNNEEIVRSAGAVDGGPEDFKQWLKRL